MDIIRLGTAGFMVGQCCSIRKSDIDCPNMHNKHVHKIPVSKSSYSWPRERYAVSIFRVLDRATTLPFKELLGNCLMWTGSLCHSMRTILAAIRDKPLP